MIQAQYQQGNEIYDDKELQKLVVDKFRRAYQLKYKKPYLSQSSPHTVLAAIIIRDKTSGHLHFVSLATGTKSLPNDLVRQYGKKLVADMHAEVLAVKAFRKYLLHASTKATQSNHNNHNQQQDSKQSAPQSKMCHNAQIPWITTDAKRDKLKFERSRYEIIMYTSQVPCGDCSIDQTNQNYSGAKPLAEFRAESYSQESKYTKGILRTKPGRLDLPRSKRSLSLSCSDKFMKWSVLGVQGRRLSNLFRPIYLDRLVIQRRHNFVREQDIIAGISIYRRTKLVLRNLSLTDKQIQRSLFHIKVNSKEKRFTYQYKVHIPQVRLVDALFNLRSNSPFTNIAKMTETSLVYCESPNPNKFVDSTLLFLEQINGHTGLKHGSALKAFSNQKAQSAICTERIYNGMNFIEKEYQYKELKQRIKHIFGLWIGQFKEHVDNPSSI